MKGVCDHLWKTLPFIFSCAQWLGFMKRRYVNIKLYQSDAESTWAYYSRVLSGFSLKWMDGCWQSAYPHQIKFACAHLCRVCTREQLQDEGADWFPFWWLFLSENKWWGCVVAFITLFMWHWPALPFSDTHIHHYLRLTTVLVPSSNFPSYFDSGDFHWNSD